MGSDTQRPQGGLSTRPVGRSQDAIMGNTTIRWTVVFSGDVQGVGFRYTTRSVARDFEITGYVRNLRDGRVEVVAEGTAEELEQFIRRVREEMGGHIQDQKVITGPGTGEFAEFEVRY